jgi:hypothetical protein
MALFKDSPISSIEDLHGHDTQLLDVANAENIDVTRKIALAQDEVAMEINTLLARLDASTGLFGDRLPVLADKVVVTPPLKLWHTFHSLEMVYRDAYNSQLNDRYKGKRDEYHELAKWAYEKLIQSGVGIAQDALPQAAMPALGVAPGGLPDGTYYVAAAWTNAGGEEGAASLPGNVMTGGCTFSVQAVSAPANARGWNVYAGTDPYGLVLQNAAVLRVGDSWVQPNSLVTVGRPPGTGQAPTYMRRVPRMIQRG